MARQSHPPPLPACTSGRTGGPRQPSCWSWPPRLTQPLASVGCRVTRFARLSIIAQAQTLWSQASAWGEQAVAAFELAGDRAATARARANVGRALLNEGRLDEAVRSLQVAEEELWALSDPMGRAVALESLGLAQILLARRSEGVGLLGRALSLVEAANDRAAASRIRQQLTDLGGPQD